MIQIKEPLHPLGELQIVLILGFRELFNFDVFVHFAFGESILEDLEIVDELPFILGFPCHFGHIDSVREQTIHDGTMDCSCAQLFYFLKVQLE